MCRISNYLKLADQKSVQFSPLSRRKYQELQGKPINLVRYEFKCQIGEKMQVKKQEPICTDYWSKVETSIKQPDEREQLWSESRMDLFESFYNIPADIGVTEYDLEQDVPFDNQEYYTPSPYDDH